MKFENRLAARVGVRPLPARVGVRPLPARFGVRPLLVRAALLAGAALLPSRAAVAQSMDYGSLEQVFGEPVTVAATGTPQRASVVPADMVIITQDDIRRSGSDNLFDLLVGVPGLELRRNEQTGVDAAVRGFNSQGNPRLLVLLNGRPVFDDYNGFVVWYNIPVALEDIRQIEVVKGPNSALFGFNAASGVINIVTYDPMYDRINTVSVRTGTQSLAEGSAVVTGNQQGVGGLRLSATGFDIDELQRPADEKPAGVHPETGNVSALGDYLLPGGYVATLEAGVSNVNGNVDEAIPLGYTTRTNYIRADIGGATPIGQTNLQYFRTQNRDDLIGLADVVNDVNDLQLSDLLKLGAAHTLRFALEWKDNTAESPVYFNGTAGYRVLSASGMWNWQISGPLSLTNAVRFDHLNETYTGTGLADFGLSQHEINSNSVNGYSFNSGLVWAITDADTLRLIGGRGLQLPSIGSLQGQLPFGVHVYDLGNPTLPPTAVTSVELSYERSVPALLSTLHAAVYAERNDDLNVNGIAGLLHITPYGIAVQSGLIGHADAEGIELGVKGAAPNGLVWNAYYTHEAIADHLHQGLTADEQSSFAHSTPHDVLYADIGYHAGKFEADLNGHWQSQFVDFGGANVLVPEPKLIGAFLSVNARVAYEILRNTTLAVSGAQLLHDRLEETFGPEVERRVIVSLTYKL